jgi:hypothetical protein
LEVDGATIEQAVSYMPNDFLLELTEALLHVLRGPGEWVACMNQEPGEIEWRFFRVQDGVVLSLVAFPDQKRIKGTGEKIFECSGYPLDIVLPLWRGLSELSTRHKEEHFRKHWCHPFPESEICRLSDAVKQVEATNTKA